MIWLLACVGSPTDSAAVDSGDAAPAPVVASLTLLDVVSGAPLEGVSVSSDTQSITTDATGTAALSVAAGEPFSLLADSGDLPHRYIGVAGSADLSIVGFLASSAITAQVYAMLGLTLESGRGIVVAAMDLPDLTPAYGASAALSAEHGGSFVFGPSLPEPGDTLIEGGSSVVFFPDIAPGTATLSITPPEGLTCALIDAGSDTAEVTVEADQVTVAVFVCQ